MKRLLRFAGITLVICTALPAVLLGQGIYWTQETYGNARVREASKAGSILADTVAGNNAFSRPQGIAVDPANNKIYWAGGFFSGADIFRSALDLGTQDSLGKNGSSFRGIALDVAHGKIYWTTTNLVTGPQIRRSNLNGSGDTVLIDFYSFHTASESLSGPKGIALDIPDGKMYWTDDLGNRIRMANLDGSSIQTLGIAGVAGPVGIALDFPRWKMYWTEVCSGGSSGRIRCAYLDGQEAAALYTGRNHPNYIALDPEFGKMYWTETNAGGSTGSIMCANLNGTGAGELIAGISDPLGIAVPYISSQGNITVCAVPGECNSLLSFSVQATGDPVIQCAIGGTPVTSPYSFPVGSTTVTCTVPGSADGLTASFVVTVKDTVSHITVAPDSFNVSIASGDSTKRIVTISNPGACDSLTFKVTSKTMAPPGRAVPVKYQERKIQSMKESSPRKGSHSVASVQKPVAVSPKIRRQSGTAGAVLIIGDGSSEYDAKPVLDAAGYDVTIGAVEYAYYGTNPPLSSFNAVILFDGPTYDMGIPLSGQDSLVAYVNRGGGLLFTEWIANDVLDTYDSDFVPLLLVPRSSGGNGTETYTVIQAHPITSGLPPSFSVAAGYNISSGPPSHGTVLISGSSSGNAVTIDNIGKGRVAQYAMAANWDSFKPFLDGNMQLLLVNTVRWLSTPEWLTADPLSGSIPPDGSVDVTVKINATGLNAGDYMRGIVITSSDPRDSIHTVPLALHVSGLLPIELASFSGTAADAGVSLAWATLSEVNNYGFYVERRDGKNAVYKIVSDLIPGAGTSLEEHYYSWTDTTAPAGELYYRLNQVDLNGGQTYSGEIRVTVGGALGVKGDPAPREFSLKQNYPNPFNPSTTVRFSVEKPEHAVVKVFNMLGEEVMVLFDGPAEPGHYYVLSFDASSLSSGLYFCRITTDSRTAVEKMMLLK